MIIVLANLVLGAKFVYRSYDAILKKFDEMQKAHPDTLEVFDALERWPHIGKGNLPQCNGADCKWIVAHIANKEVYKSNRMPEMYFSGCLHGDEIVGPNIATGFADFVLTEYKNGHPKIKHLLDTRSIWITPMTNAYGYAQSKQEREEMSVDPNRDFPYNDYYRDGGKTCMKTIAARVVAELYKHQMIQISVTFHGGWESVSYLWGSPNHAMKNTGSNRPGQCGDCSVSKQDIGCCISKDAPDLNAFKAIGKAMFLAYGKTPPSVCRSDPNGNSGSRPLSQRGYTVPGYDGCWYSKEPDTSTDDVYAVNGGLEDFSYAYSWESEKVPADKNPIPAECSSSNYGGYTMKNTEWADTVKQVNFLVETTDTKGEKSDYGDSDEVYRKSSSSDGHVSRNVRVLLRLCELLLPEILIDTSSSKYYGYGCDTFKARLVKWPRVAGKCGNPADVEEEISFPEAKCVGLHPWQESDEAQKKFPIDDALMHQLPDVSTLDAEFCWALGASFDAAWADQGGTEPDPSNTTPQSHLVRARTQESYTVKNAKGAGPFIQATKERFFPLKGTTIPTPSGGGGSPDDEEGESSGGPDLKIVAAAAGGVVLLAICALVVRNAMKKPPPTEAAYAPAPYQSSRKTASAYNSTRYRSSAAYRSTPYRSSHGNPAQYRSSPYRSTYGGSAGQSSVGRSRHDGRPRRDDSASRTASRARR